MKCCGYGEGCECSSCLDLRMEEQREWEHYQQVQQDDQHNEWVRETEEPF